MTSNLSAVEGITALLRGIKWLFTHPKYLFLGALPIIGSFVLLIAAVLVLAIFSPSIAELVDPLTSSLWPWLATTIHYALQGALIVGALGLSYVLLVTVALALGDPIYGAIAQAIEREAGGSLQEVPWRLGVKEAAKLFLKGSLVTAGSFVLGFLPVIGPVLSFAMNWVLLPYFVAQELLSRTLLPKGMHGAAAKALMRKARVPMWSFGALCQLFFVVPLVPMFIMPSAVAGAALLSQRMVQFDSTVAREGTL